MAKQTKTAKRRTPRAAASQPRPGSAAFERQRVEAALRVRHAAIRRRKANIAGAPQALAAAARVPTPAMLAAAGGSESLGLLIAEGDSWFDYPGLDILSAIEEEGYDTISVAHKGHTVESMAYGDDQLVDFVRAIDKAIRQGRIPKAILLSGGGNDVAGDEFAMLLNHRLAKNGGLNEDVVRGVIEDRVRNAYVAILREVTIATQQRVNTRIPILVHGYGWAVPDGRGFLGGWGFLPGPWLEPGFRLKGFDKKKADQFQRMRDIVVDLINRFNKMLVDLISATEFAHVRYIDVRPTLNGGGDHKQWWADELHPSDRGFTAVARQYAEVLKSLPA